MKCMPPCAMRMADWCCFPWKTAILPCCLSALRSFFVFAQEEGVVTRNPVELMENPRLPQRLPEVLSREEMDRVLSAPRADEKGGVRDRCMLELLYACGVRVSELCGLSVGDVDRQRGLIRAWALRAPL